MLHAITGGIHFESLSDADRVLAPNVDPLQLLAAAGFRAVFVHAKLEDSSLVVWEGNLKVGEVSLSHRDFCPRSGNLFWVFAFLIKELEDKPCLAGALRHFCLVANFQVQTNSNTNYENIIPVQTLRTSPENLSTKEPGARKALLQGL